MNSLEFLSEKEMIALAVAHRFGIGPTFDIVADSHLHRTSWFESWSAAAAAVERSAERIGTGLAWRAQPQAAEVAGQAAIAMSLANHLTSDDYARLLSPWHEAVQSIGGFAKTRS